MSTVKLNIALLITDEFLIKNKNEKFDTLTGYWSTLRGKLEQLLQSNEVAHMHRHVTTPEAINAFCDLQSSEYVDPALLQQIATEADQNGFFSIISDNPTVSDAIDHCAAQLEYFHPLSGDWRDSGEHSPKDAAELFMLAELMHPLMGHLFWAYKIGLLN